MIVAFSDLPKKGFNLLTALSCAATLGHSWVSSVRSLSISIPSNLTVPVMLTSSLQIFKLTFV